MDFFHRDVSVLCATLSIVTVASIQLNCIASFGSIKGLEKQDNTPYPTVFDEVFNVELCN